MKDIDPSLIPAQTMLDGNEAVPAYLYSYVNGYSYNEKQYPDYIQRVVIIKSTPKTITVKHGTYTRKLNRTFIGIQYFYTAEECIAHEIKSLEAEIQRYKDSLEQCENKRSFILYNPDKMEIKSE